MVRILIAYLLSLPIYYAVLGVSFWLIPVVMSLQLLAGFDCKLPKLTIKEDE